MTEEERLMHAGAIMTKRDLFRDRFAEYDKEFRRLVAREIGKKRKDELMDRAIALVKRRSP